MSDTSGAAAWRDVLEFWFPEGEVSDVDADRHHELWFWRMRGGADEEIVERFSEPTARAAAGELDHWAREPEGRLALIILLDQFSRSLWRDSPRAYAQDPPALGLTREGLANGHYAALQLPWFRIVFGLPLGHCEGPDHLERLDLLIRLRQEIAQKAPGHLQSLYQSLVRQAQDVRKVIAAFGRHPHRNEVLGRASTPEEEAYIAEGKFPHQRAFDS